MSDLEPIEPTDPELTAQLVRRGRQSLGGDAREAILASVARSTASVRPLGRWRWTRLAAVTAALSIVLIAVVGVASLQPSQPPTTGAPILDATGVASAVAAVQQTGATQTVLARVIIGPISSRLPLICSSSDQTNCEISLGGIVGTVPEVEVVGRPLLLDSAQQSGGEYTGVFALTIDHQYTHLLGVVQPAADGSVARTATTDAVRDAEGGAVWSAVVVTGYLHPMGIMHCPEIPATGDPLADTPFAICNGSWVADHIAPEGQSPDGLITVQPNVSTFTPQGWDGNAPDMPEATYVLRLVANPTSNCTVCRGWDVVGRLSSTESAPSPSPSPPAASPVPATLLTIDVLRSAIAAVKASGASQEVLVDADLDFASVRNQFGVFCASDTPCPVARLTGATDLMVRSVPGSALWTLIHQTPQDSLQGPVAIRIDPNGELEWLGMLWKDSGSPTWPASASAVQSLDASPLWTVIAVHGWLGWSGPVPCPAPLPPTPPPDTPFDSCPGGWIGPVPSTEVGTTYNAPDDAIRVNWTAIDTYGNGADTVEGIFILRLVEDPRPGANPKYGWQVVGEVTPSVAAPGPSQSPSTGLAEPVVHTASEMSDLLRANGNAWIGHVMLVDGTLVPMGGPPCTGDPASCPIGSFDGSDQLVYVSDATAAMRTDASPTTGVFAVLVRDNGIELLGHLGSFDQGVWAKPETLAGLDLSSQQPLLTAVVDGWLGWSGPVPCEAPLPPTPPPDMPFFASCQRAWIAPTASGRGSSITPTDAITIQPEAYQEYAPESDAKTNRQPVFGRYVVRLVEWAKPDCTLDVCMGWQVVAPMNADPAAPSTSPAPVPSDATILNLDQLRAAVVGHQGSRLQPLDVIADVTVDLARGSSTSDCPDGFGSCALLGLIHGATDLGNVVQRGEGVQVSDNLAAPIGLRISDGGKLIFLGHVNVKAARSSVAWTVPEAGAGADQLAENELIAVDGWLAGGDMPSCGPAPFPASPPPVPPFDCAIHDYLTPGAEQVLVSFGGNGYSVRAPADGLPTGMNEYHEFAPNPAADESPRQGIYLVKSVINHSSLESQACTGCRGWLIVGRVQPTEPATLPPSPPPSPSPPGPTPTPAAVVEPPILNTPQVLDADELRALLKEARARPVDVVADVSVDPAFVDCANPPCPWLGVIRGLDGAFVSGRADDPYPDLTLQDGSAPVALRIDTEGAITFLGHVDISPQTGLTWTVPTAGPILKSTPLGHLLAVNGWLSTQAGRNGPAMPPGQPPPFDYVWADVLAPGSQDTSQLPGWASGPDFIRIQQGAYAQFAPGDHSSDGQPAQVGSYLVEHVAHQSPECTDCDGWLMVGRLDPPTLGVDELNAALVPGQTSIPVGTVANVRGWLVDDGPPVPCPSTLTPTAPPADIWEGCYQGAWITHDQVQPVTAYGDGFTVTVPPDSIRVQGDAYLAFAADPQYEAKGHAHVPRLGTYTLQLIRDPRFPIDGALGWEVVARVDP